MLVADISIKTVGDLLSATLVKLPAHCGDVLRAEAGIEEGVEPAPLRAHLGVRVVFLFPDAVRLERPTNVTVQVDLRWFLLWGGSWGWCPRQVNDVPDRPRHARRVSLHSLLQ